MNGISLNLEDKQNYNFSFKKDGLFSEEEED